MKTLHSASFFNLKENVLFDHLLHNRLNFLAEPGTRFAFQLGVRNRVLFGDQVKSFPGYSGLLSEDSGLVDLSFLWYEAKSFFLLTNIDRLNIRLYGEKWKITLGRQRINWGQNMVWNPNDLFNTFNFVDFDYEERPGSDAIRMEYFFGSLSRLEAVWKFDKNLKASTGAIFYSFNKIRYDWQFFAGLYQFRPTAGMGWAGALKGAGFKGEIAYAHSEMSKPSTHGHWSASLSFDYMQKKGWYFALEGLVNTAWQSEDNLLTWQTSGDLSPFNLFPAKTALFGTILWPATPLLRISAGTIYSPDENLWLVIPGIDLSIKENLDLTLMAQLFFEEKIKVFQLPGKSIFFRLKRSF